METPELDVYIFLFIGTLVMFLLAGGVVAFFIMYQKRLFRQQLLVREIETNYKEELLNSNIEMVEEERKRVAKDLHDEVGSLLSTLRLKIGQIPQSDPVQQLQIISDTSDMIDAGIQNVRRISHNITPPGLEMFGLVDTLEDFCEKITASKSIEAYLQCETRVPRLKPQIELGLYRVVQELVNNTLRHAEASLIRIQLAQEAQDVTLTYSDNGKGFEPDMVGKAKGLGLKNIEARINLIKGTFEWQLKPGAGMKLIIKVYNKLNE